MRSGYRLRDTKTGSSLQWTGVLMLILGVLVPFLFGIPILIGLVLIVFGSVKARGCICSSCGNPVHRTSMLCPTCGANLQEPESSSFWSIACFFVMILMVIGYFTQERWEPGFTRFLQRVLGNAVEQRTNSSRNPN